MSTTVSSPTATGGSDTTSDTAAAPAVASSLSASTTADLLHYIWLSLSYRRRAREELTAIESSAAFCVSPLWNWTQNIDGDEPCLVARRLLHSCGPSTFANYPIQPLYGIGSYPPLTATQASPCACNIPLYNLVQVCGACQHTGLFPNRTMPWRVFSASCDYPDMLAFPLQENVSIPDWALRDYRGGVTNISSAFHQVTLATPSNETIASPIVTSYPLTPTPSTITIPANATNVPEESHGGLGVKEGVAIGASVVSAVGIILAAIAFVYMRKQRRTRVQGQRLGSASDLSEGKDDGAAEKETSTVDPSMRWSRTSYTASSFMTNSASSQGQWTSSPETSTSYTESISSSTTGGSGTANESIISFDDVASPFADTHRARDPNVTHLSPETARTRLSISTYASYEGGDDFSRSSTRSPAPSTAPSSTGAVYGRNGGSIISI